MSIRLRELQMEKSRESIFFVELASECSHYCDLSSRIAEFERLIGFIAITYVLREVDFASEVIEIGTPAAVWIRVLLLLRMSRHRKTQTLCDQLLMSQEAHRRGIIIRQFSAVDSIENLITAKSEIQDLCASSAHIWRQIRD